MCMVTFDWKETDAKEKAAQFKKKRTMVWAVIEVTNSCNFNCKWCYASSGYSSNHMSKENLTKLVGNLADSGVRQITYSGGEPTMYPYIREAVKIAKDYGFVVHMNSNGYLITREMAKELKSLGLSQVQTNIDSIDPKKHDKIRGKEGSFQRAVKALKNVKEAGMTPVCQTVLTKMNENEIFDIFKLGRSLGTERCRTWDMMPVGFAKGKMDLRPTNYIETLKKLDKFAYENGAIHIESGEPFFPLDYETNLDITNIPCVARAGLLINISFDGEVYYCVTNREPMFNVFKDTNGETLEKVYRDKLAEFVQLRGILSKCEGCEFLTKCSGGCYTRRKYSDGYDYWCKDRIQSS
ncbi:MAG: radical SAM protein [Candidatus Aenigmarchaeota archaeon]|nr:radical SAM protein [Candidatus Aenigmarchaeota archaeon]